MSETNQNLIINLCELLMDQESKTENITLALNAVKSRFLLDKALIYETNLSGDLELKESVPNECRESYEQLSYEKFRYFFDVQETAEFYIIDKSVDHPKIEELLNIFNTTTLYLFPHFNQNQIYSIVIFSISNPTFSDNDMKLLKLAGCLLLKYIMPRMYKTQLFAARKALENVLDNTGIDIYVNDFYTHEILYVNESMAKPYGGKEKFMNKKCWEVLFPSLKGECEFCPQKRIIDENGEPTKVYTWDYQRELDGSWFRVFSAAFRWIDGRLAHVVSSADITDNKKNEALIKYLANYDSLTGLPNRRMLVEECERRINHVSKADKGYILFFDIDGFKKINDTFGHDIGDEFLICLGQFFNSLDYLKDAIYRNGGDEFIAVLNGDIGEERLKQLIDKIHERFDSPWILKGHEAKCNVSVGVACYPKDGVTAERLFAKADQAMYEAKRAGGAQYCFGRDIK
ncbi:sensor domain-containing diguanylate cyclase [Anaerorhabdus sp.]|uniref:sensor domain-containing diguanylate cyclase n=1 Tax=Anaerorhabdus sp. TaxID=1872524 RepID=UPI002FCB2EAB